jgi:HTH-type transcriptional regulator, quorum sensing regulator NprR
LATKLVNYGSVIKYHRGVKNWTQAELCDGICSITHLSKIENNSKEADLETIHLLLKRLGITLEAAEEKNTLVSKSLSQLLQAILYFDAETAKEKLEILKMNEDYISISNNVFSYNLYLYRYYLFINDEKLANEQQKVLKKLHKSFSAADYTLYSYFNALWDIQRKNYRESLEKLKELEDSRTIPHYLSGEFNYYMALNYGQLMNISSSITYAERSLTFFTSQHNFTRIIHTQLLLGISYTDFKLFKQAEEVYEHLLRNIKMFKHELITPVYHNYAILLGEKRDYEEAARYYHLAMEHARTDLEYNLILCNLTELMIDHNQAEAMDNVEKIINLENLPRKEKLVFKYYDFLLSGKEKAAMRLLEKEVLPYLESKYLIRDYKKYAVPLAEYYTSIDQEKALFLYKKINT